MGQYLFTPEKEPKKTIIYIQGNIGCGKSTLIDQLKALDYEVWDEGLTQFLETHNYDVDNKSADTENKENLLKLFYGDMAKYSFEMQVAWMATRLSIFRQMMESENKLVFMERSLESDLNTFAKLLFENKMMSVIQYRVFKELSDSIAEYISSDVVQINVYLNASAEVCFVRKNGRNRDEEATVSLEYLRSLKSKHDEWIAELSYSQSEYQRVYMVDANNTKETVVADVIRIANNATTDSS